MTGIAAIAIAYMLSQFYRSFMAVLTPALIVDLGTTKAQLSLASGAWFAAFALMQFVIGIALDRYGPRRTTALIFGLGGGGGALIFAAATKPWMIVAGMALIGAGCAPVLMAGMFVFARSYPPARLAVLSSWLIGIGTAGNIIGTTPLARAAEAFGWRGVLVVVALAAILAAAAVLLLLRDPPAAITPAGQAGGLRGYWEVLKLRDLWPLLPIIGATYAPMIGVLGLWAGPFLADVHDGDALIIGQVTFFMALAAVVGSFVYGPLDTIFGTRKWVAVVGNGASVLVLAWLAAYPTQSVLAITIALALLGLFGQSFALLMAHARAFIPAHLTGRGMTLLNFFSIGLVGVMQFFSGGVVTAATVADQPAAAYSALFAFYAATLGLAVLIYLGVRDARPETNPIIIAPARRQR